MKINKAGTLGVCLLATALGCGQSRSSSESAISGVAVIDLDEVAKQLGRDREIVEAIQQRQQAHNQRLTQLAGGYVEQLQKHRDAGAGETAEGGVQLAQYEQQANQNLSQAKQQAREDLTQHQQQLVSQFRESVRPVAREVARRRGFAVIVTRQDSLLYDYAPEADITSEVIEALAGESTTTAD